MKGNNMTRNMLYIIESRKPDGSLDFAAPQPEQFFGPGAIAGMSADAMAKAIFRKVPDANLRGDAIPLWPSLIDSRWRARPKTW